MNGTTVSTPHCEQCVRVSERTTRPGRSPRPARLLLQLLQRFGSFLNCLSLKNSCSPAVNTKSCAQSAHFNIRSTYSISHPSALFLSQSARIKRRVFSESQLADYTLADSGPIRRVIAGLILFKARGGGHRIPVSIADDLRYGEFIYSLLVGNFVAQLTH